MGLDMYLYKKNHLSEEQETTLREAKAMIETYNELFDMEESKSRKDYWLKQTKKWQDKLATIPEDTEVCYWRKANAIHAWFERYLQREYGIEEIEDCESYVITTKCLEELVADCKSVLAYSQDKCFKEVAARYMPTQAGFFYGSTDYDEWYVGDLQATATKLASILLDSDEDDEFTYLAWW